MSTDLTSTRFDNQDEVQHSIDLKRIESCYAREKKTLSWKCNNNNSNKERSFDFILAAKNDKINERSSNDVCWMTKKSVQDQFLKALSGVLIVSDKIPSHVRTQYLKKNV